MLTLEALFAQPDNDAVLRWMARHLTAVRRMGNPAAAEVRWPEEIRYFRAGVEPHPLDEAGCALFLTYGRQIPAAARCSVEIYNLLAHERTARIFAFQSGRWSFALRRDLARWPHGDGDEWRNGDTIDGTFDLRPLGSGWFVFHREDSEEEGWEPHDELRWAYEHAGR
jgi:hypothetical protein